MSAGRVTPSQRQLDRVGLRARLVGLLAAMVIASVLTVAFAAVAAFDRAVDPELVNRTRLIGSIVRSEIQRALELGIPIDALAGVDRYLSETLDKFAEVDRITITTAAGVPVAAIERPAGASLVERSGLGEIIAFRRTVFTLPILDGNRLVGGITVEISPLFVQTRLRDVFLDVMVIALVATLVALELALAVAVSSVGKPLDRVLRLLRDQREGNFRYCIRPGGLSGLGRAAARLNDHAEDLAARAAALPAALRSKLRATIAAGRPARLRLSDFNDIRLAMFIFSVATEIASAFMPVYALGTDRPDWLDPEIAAAAPIVFYLAAIGALSPFGSTLVGRFGARRLFLMSVPGAALALAGLGLSDSLIAVTIWQGTMAAFYATAAIACQEYAIRAGGKEDSARAVGAFLAVVYGGLFSGSALGGLIASRFGFTAAFLTGAALALLALVLGAASMRGRAGDRDPEEPALTPDQSPARHDWLNARYVVLLVGVAVPMNATMVIFLWYLTPLMLTDLGSGPADIARVLMLCNVAPLLLGPMVARLTDSRIGPAMLIVIGGLGIAGSLLSLGLWSGFWPIAVAVTGVGASQIVVENPLYTVAFRLAGGTGPGIDALRVLERVGAILGLVTSAALLGLIGAEDCLRLLGIAVLLGIAAYAIVEFAGRVRRA